ncbi:T9SS type B sorting domain-containing protein [Flavobacterium sangjuense]|uniref:Uncharacterized protein n=1 Tax=Flavobacterium sangjuense TaxID=2518177 RepID=A0A4P7PVV5_9FLAO|nr:T9SS type B sorting domain-containing protein [Flavobacterium sangjuense]QBZ98926.1 hypothetical protein GS03_02438 [Flavobacterium sangjuense]
MKNVFKVFFLLFLSNLAFAQEPNDCATALIVCGNGAFSSNATGSGTVQEINSCGGFENNSIWLEVNIVQAGTLGFNLIPDDPDINVDYDFWVYGPNRVCGALGSPLRCATTNPFEAGLSNNLTGMNGSTLLTQTGPGSDGNGYVRWLTVTPGQTYYIAIDRPIGDGGFQIQWTGTATLGTGAFPSPPSANAIPDVLTCSNTPNVGIFDLSALSSSINSDTTGNTITYHTSTADANDGVNALPNIYSNTSNPQTICARVTDNIAGCYSIVCFNLVVNLVPNASVSISNTSICTGSPVTVTFTGTPNANISYTVDSGPVQSAVLNAAGIFTITTSPTLASSYTLTNVRIVDGSGNTLCTQPLNQTVSVAVTQLPTATISGTTTICSGTSAVITFSGTPNATVTYTVGSGPNQTILLDGSGTATITTPLLTMNSTYNLVSVATSGTPVCSQSQTGSATVTVLTFTTPTFNPIAPICSGVTLAALPTTSNNSITGTWSPALDNTTTTTYTFTPNPGQCASPVNITIIVNPLIGVTVNSSAICSSGIATVTATPTLAGTYNYAWTVPAGFPNPGNVASFTTTTSGTYTVVISQTNSFCNAGFDSPVGVPSGGMAFVNQASFPCWRTTATDGIIEVWSSGFQSTPSYSGTQFVELNANQVSTLYQNLTVVPGTTAIISFAHRGRFSGTDVLQVQIGPVGGPYTSLGSFSATPAAWVFNTISYIFPNDGVTNYTIRFVSISSGSGDLTVGNFIDAVSITGLGCSSLPVSGTVTISPQPTAGVDGGTAVCENSTVAVDLFSLITGEAAGGTWVRTTGTGGTFNAAAGTYTPVVGATSSTFTYTVTGTAPCTTDSSVATITINAQPTAGVDGGTIVCDTSVTAINLFSLITGEQAGGVWTQTSGTGGTFNAVAGTYTPAAGATTSTFTYTVNGTAPCINDTSLATVTINPQPNAGVDGGTVVCETSTTAVDLFSLISGEQTGGVWTQTSGTGGTFNGVAGTYTPAVGATTSTFTYTLIGTAPCINDSSLATITINPQPIAGTDGGTTICENNAALINLYTLITGEQAGGTWTRTTGTGGTFNAAAGTFVPALGVTTSTFTYTLTGTAPCINVSSIATVTINPLPTATIFGTTTVCLNDPSPQIIFTGANGTAPYTFTYSINTVVQPPVSTTSGNSVSVNVPTTPQGTYTYALVSVQDAAAPACSQAQTGSAVVTVNTAPIINTPTAYVVCDDSLDNTGFYCGFDLTTKNTEITSDPTVVITYHETQTDADIGGTTITTPTSYCNLNPFDQIIYVRASFAGAAACYSTTSFHLIVNPIPLPNPVITDYELCDYNNPGDGIEVFNLGTKTTEIANGQTGVTVTYYATLADAQTQTSPLPNLYPNTSNPQQIWINIRDNATGCNTTSSFNLIVNPLPAVTVAPDLNECSIGSSTTAEFDLTVNEGTVTNGVTGMIVTYYNTLAAAQNGSPTIIGSPSAYIGNDNETVYIRVENIATGCYATTTQLLRVTQGPTAITPLPLHYCDPNNDGFGVFDLSSTINEITGTPPGSPLPAGVSVTFHETLTDSQTGANPKPSPYYNITINTQTIYVRVFYTLTGCANYVNLQLIVDPTPVATEPDDYQLCDYTGAAGYETFDLTSTISDILGTINPLTHTVTFYTTQAAAELGTGNITNPTSYTNGTINTQTIYVRVETTATGCYDIVTLQLIVNPLPNATQPNYPQYSLCDTTGLVGFETFDLASQVSAILLGQTGMAVTFYPSLGEAQSNSNAITNLQYTNAVIYVQTLGIRITNTDTDCYVISTMDIRVEPLPTPIPPPAPYTVCDENQDGFANFDLTTLLPGLLNGMTTYTITFHETIDDANSGDNDIDTSVPYFSIDPFVQILYVRAEDNVTHCYSVLPIELNADPSPIAPVNLDPITVCDQDSSPQSASTTVDLTQTTAAVLAQQTGAAADYTVEYYTTQLLAEQGNSPIINDTSYIVSDGTTIWVRVEHKTTGCFNVGSFQIEIDTPLLLTTPAPLSVCDADDTPNNQFHVFDLTIKNTEINQGTGYTVTYYPSLTDAQNNTNVITTPTAYQNVPAHPAVQTLGVVVTTAAGCKSITTLDIRVLPIPTPNRNPTPLAPKCDDNNPGDMMEVFDLTVNEAYIANGDPNLTFHYFATRDNAVDNVSELIPATAALVGDNVWIRVENNRVDYQGENCYVIVEQALTVNPLPIVVQPLAPYRACDDNADGIAVFDLTNPDLAEAILGPTQLPADYAISYHPSQAAATAGTPTLPNSYTNVTPNAQDIYVRVVNNATSCVNTGVLPLVVEAYARAVGPQQFNECDNDGNPYDGVGLVDLTSYAADILDGQDAAIFIVSYYTSLANAVAGTNALTLAQAQAYQTDADTDTIWVKVENSSNLITPVCYAITTIDIKVERYPNPVINTANNVTTICVDFITNQVVRPLTLNSGVVNPNNYTYEWFEDASTTPIPGATGPTYTVDTPAVAGATREYTVRVTSASPLACQTTSASFPVVQSGQAVIAAGTVGYTVTGAFSSSQIITVTVEGYGAPDYQYSLDDGPRQDSNVFEGVSMGTHIIHVWDAKGDIAYSCEELIINEVYIIDYPHYFTPNGDGIHDTWNVVGLDESAKIFIFDRYGKLLKQISPTGQGWNGTYNGHLLPSDDYWFTVDFVEGGVMKQFKSHFAMKR